LYPNGDYKPTGLIQKNSLKLNFAAFGYLLDGNIQRDGGVMRARMAALGPTMKSGSTVVNNPNTEWDVNTGIFILNPDPADATASNVTNSGVINYLNKFGLTNKSYKGYDPVGELYYSTTRYFRKKGNVVSYTSAATSTMIDGFPVITAWDDPVKDACQSNFIIGVGDTNTHADADLPGSTIRSANEPSTTPAEVIADTGSLTDATNATTNFMDVRVSTN
jgi:type IV pilus assembly protein PilY1